MRWVRHVARVEDMRGAYRVLVGKRELRVYFEDPGIYGRTILKDNFKKWEESTWTVSTWLRIVTGGGLL